MGRMKDLLIGIQELAWTAYELGARDVDAIYAYVYQYEPRASYEMVEAIVDEMLNPQSYDHRDYGTHDEY